jgi:ABC-type multidrug transport system ATPase subunit
MTETQDSIILLDGASRRFGRRQALKGIDLRVKTGTMLGLIGPNGSGKTTLLKLMAGFIKATSGTVLMFGHDPFIHRTEVMRRARFAFAPPPIYGTLSALEHLKFLAAAGARPSERIGRSQIMQVLETVGLAHRAHDKASTFSCGMKQRLGLAQALLPRPQLLVFDEPTDGLDPLAVAELRGILKGLQTDYNLTIVLSSHLLSEVEKLVDTLLLLNEGRAMYHGSPDGLLDGGRKIEMRIEGNLEAGIAALRRHGFKPEINGNQRLMLPRASIRLHDAANLLEKQGLKLVEFHEKRPGLADAYLQRLKDGFDRPQQ